MIASVTAGICLTSLRAKSTRESLTEVWDLINALNLSERAGFSVAFTLP